LNTLIINVKLMKAGKNKLPLGMLPILLWETSRVTRWTRWPEIRDKIIYFINIE